MGVTDQPPEQPRQPKLKTERTTRIKVIMGSRAVQHFHRRNPSQHRVLASIIDDMNKESRMKNLKMHKSGARITNVPIDIEPMEVEEADWTSREEGDLEQGPAASEEHQSETEVAQNLKDGGGGSKDFENVRGGEHTAGRPAGDPGRHKC